MKVSHIYIALLMLLLPAAGYGQAGMTFGEFSEKISKYFAEELVDDVREALPQGKDYRIWGWDVGDYSGDGFNDLAFAVKMKDEKRKKMRVYMFVDVEGFLTEADQQTYDYVELPLEVGVVIKEGGVYVTQKLKQFDWVVCGFKYQYGSLINLSRFSTCKVDEFTKECLVNYQDLKTRHKVIKIKGDTTVFDITYNSLPSYPRGNIIYNGIKNEICADKTEYVYKGAFDWKGAEDGSFRVRSSYDKEFLYFTFDITDEAVTKKICDTCEADHIDLWINSQPLTDTEKRFQVIKDGKIEANTALEGEMMKISVYPGDFKEEAPFVQISATDTLDEFRKESANGIKATSNVSKGGWTLKFKVPFSLVNPFIDISKLQSPLEFLATFVFVDVDSEYRTEELSEIASTAFVMDNPYTYGTLIILPEDKRYGESKNVFRDEVLKYLNEYGF